MEAVVGIDIGGSGTKGALVDLVAGQFAAPRVRLPTPSPATPDRVADVVVELLAQLDAPGPVGLTLPAVVRGGIVETAANIDETWIGTNALELFGRAAGRPVAVVNDADAAGLAEVRFGAGRGRSGVTVVITLGTGIGSAVFVDGTLVPNTELGHLPLHHGDAEDWAADSIRREGRSLLEGVGAPARALPRAGRAGPVAAADHHRWRCEQEVRASSCPTSTSAPSWCRPGCTTTPASSAPRSSPRVRGPPAHPAPAPPTDQPPRTPRRR